jgi:sugar/nucleoside kinase (ribokinase family)
MNKKILGIGNAIVDVFAQVEEHFLKQNNLIKGSMKLINEEEFFQLKQKIKIEKILAGGSVANSMAGISYLNGDASFIGKINSDEFGELYKKSLEDIDVKFIYNSKKELMPTGTCIILITPDSERTMCTYLGISSQLAANDLNEKNIVDKELIFLEGYLWDKGLSEKMFKQAINFAKKNKVKIAMTLSDIFCVTRHKADFYNLLKNDLDVLIGNENEINELTGNKNLSNSVNQLTLLNKLIIVTRSEKGSLAIDNNIIIDCDSIQVNKVIDVTGAGDLFAAGFLKEYIEKSEIKKCLTTGSLMASKIIQKIGARIE